MRAALLERLNGGRHEPDFIQRGLLVAGSREREVAVVHRIETAAENAETHEGGLGARGWGLGTATHLRITIHRSTYRSSPQPPVPSPMPAATITFRHRAGAVGAG